MHEKSGSSWRQRPSQGLVKKQDQKHSEDQSSSRLKLQRKLDSTILLSRWVIDEVILELLAIANVAWQTPLPSL